MSSIAGCQLSHQVTESLKRFSVSSNPSVIMTRIVGFYDLTATIDLLSLLLTENSKIMNRPFKIKILN